MTEVIVMKYALMAALVVSLAAPSAALAQAKTDFSGTWTFDEAKSDPAPARAGGGGGGGGGRGGGRMGGAPPTALTIKQSASELTMDRTTAQGAQTVIYKLDGSESKNTIGMGPATSKAVWDGPRLVINCSISGVISVSCTNNSEPSSKRSLHPSRFPLTANSNS